MPQRANVFGFLAAPSRESSMRAISMALLKVRALDGMTCESIGKLLDCSADTIRNATNEETLLSFDAIARLCYFFPDEAKPVRELIAPEPRQQSIHDKFDALHSEIEELRKFVTTN